MNIKCLISTAPGRAQRQKLVLMLSGLLVSLRDSVFPVSEIYNVDSVDVHVRPLVIDLPLDGSVADQP